MLELQKLEKVTFWRRLTVDDDDQDVDEATSSVRRLIDVIVTSERLQHQRNLGDELLSNDTNDESAIEVCRPVTCVSDVPAVFWEPDTSATRHFGTTKLVLKFKTNHRWSCVSSELPRVEVSRLFLDHGTRVEVSRRLVPRFWCRSVLRSVPKCPRVS